jgi:hypothetical protein
MQYLKGNYGFAGDGGWSLCIEWIERQPPAPQHRVFGRLMDSAASDYQNGEEQAYESHDNQMRLGVCED